MRITDPPVVNCFLLAVIAALVFAFVWALDRPR